MTKRSTRGTNPYEEDISISDTDYYMETDTEDWQPTIEISTEEEDEELETRSYLDTSMCRYDARYMANRVIKEMEFLFAIRKQYGLSITGKPTVPAYNNEQTDFAAIHRLLVISNKRVIKRWHKR